MNLSTKPGWFAVAAVGVLLGSGVAYMYKSADPPGYCRAQQRYIPSDEFLNMALKLREEEIARHGGINAYEKEPQFTPQTGGPDGAGRDFNPRSPNCCRVYFGEMVERNCGWDYPVCVKLNYRTSREPVEYGDVGRLYFFDSCGHIQDPL